MIVLLSNETLFFESAKHMCAMKTKFSFSDLKFTFWKLQKVEKIMNKKRY